MRQRRTLYRWKAGVRSNNLPQTESRSTHRLWRYPPLSKILPALYLIHPSQQTVISWALMRQGRTLYHCVAGSKPNNLLQSDPGLELWLWRNLPLSSRIARVLIKTTLTRVSDFLSSDATETSFIPLRSWRQAQQCPAIRFTIGAMVVEGSAIEFWDCQHTIQYRNFMDKGRGGMYLIPSCS